MKLRTPFLAVALVAAPALAACSDDSSSGVTVPPGNTPVETQVPDTDAAPSGDGYEHASGADDVVLRIGYEGGFIGPGVDFSRTPTLLVAGDGSVYTPGATTLQYPGPLVLPTQRATLAEEGIQALLALADEHGLLADVGEYPRNDLIADAPDTVVEITVGGTTYRHQAYALGLEGGAANETDPLRRALAEFVEAATNVGAAVPEGALSEAEVLTGDLEIQAIPADPANYEDPTIVEWASDSGVTLAGAGQCALVPTSDAAASTLLADATAITLFTEGDATYTLAVRPQLPGNSAC